MQKKSVKNYFPSTMSTSEGWIIKYHRNKKGPRPGVELERPAYRGDALPTELNLGNLQ